MDRPFDHFKDVFRKSNEQNKELFKYIFEKSDSISLWVIGLSIGGISIFANNIGNVKKAIEPGALKPILILLGISVASGIIYRTLYLYYYALLTQVLRGMELSFSSEKVMDIYSSLNGTETYEQVIAKIKNSFDQDLSTLIPSYNQMNDEGKPKLYQNLIAYHNNLVDFYQKDTAWAIDFIADTYSKFTGTKKEKYLKSFQSGDPSFYYKWSQRLCVVFYCLYLLTFIVALFWFIAQA